MSQPRKWLILQPERFKVHGCVGQEPMGRLWYIGCLHVMQPMQQPKVPTAATICVLA